MFEAAMEGGGKKWVRVEVLGRGSYGTVSLAKSRTRRRRRQSGGIHEYPSLMAVKSAEISDSGSLQKEKEILGVMKQCPYVVDCYGEEFTDEKNGEMVYNILLEYASGGTLAKLIKKSGPEGLPESEIRRFTRSILRGLYYIHRKGYVHLDIKPQNILLVKSKKRKRGFGVDAKIADFGCARRYRGRRRIENDCMIGTPQYMSPESITHYKQEPVADIWALGCVVVEMLTGKPALSYQPGEDVDSFLYRIGTGLESPQIPSGMSKEGQDFLKRCFVRNSQFRWTAEMLLLHPFVAVEDSDKEEVEEFVAASVQGNIISEISVIMSQPTTASST